MLESGIVEQAEVEADMDSRNTRKFATVLDDLLTETADEADDASRPAATLDYLAVAEELHSGRIVISNEDAAAEYEGVAEREEAEAPPLAPEIAYPDTDPESVARELGPLGAKKVAELDALRRRFAMTNHPDCVVPDLREYAMVRMQIANMLIDEAKRGAKR